jgi:hypothetical protein
MKTDTPACFTHVSLGAWDPEGCLVCVLDDPAAERAMATLQAAGFATAHIYLFRAAELLAFCDTLHHQPVLKKVFFFLTNLSDDAMFEAEYQEQARRGHSILVVHAPGRELCDRALARLRAHHAHSFKYYGPWTVRGFD